MKALGALEASNALVRKYKVDHQEEIAAHAATFSELEAATREVKRLEQVHKAACARSANPGVFVTIQKKTKGRLQRALKDLEQLSGQNVSNY